MIAQRLAQNRLNACEDISDPMSEFVVEQLSHAFFLTKLLKKPAVALRHRNDDSGRDTIEDETGQLLRRVRINAPFRQHKKPISSDPTQASREKSRTHSADQHGHQCGGIIRCEHRAVGADQANEQAQAGRNNNTRESK